MNVRLLVESVFEMIFVLRCVSEIRWEWRSPIVILIPGPTSFTEQVRVAVTLCTGIQKGLYSNPNRDLTYLECFVWVSLVAPKFRARLLVGRPLFSNPYFIIIIIIIIIIIYLFIYLFRVVIVATGPRTRRSGVESRQWKGTFIFFKTSRPALGQCSVGAGVLFS